MKIAFFGTGEFSRNILEKILEENSVEVGLVVSQPDKPVGRKNIITETPVKLLAKEKNIKVLQPEKLKNNTEFFKELEGFDFIVVVAYGKIVPKEVLEAPTYGCINIHGSILPSYRGASPIQESLKNGDKKTGLTIMYMSEEMDEGDILNISEISINKEDKAEQIFKKFEDIGPKLLIKTLNQILSGDISPKKQDESKASYCSKISKEDGRIRWEEETANQIFNKYKAYSPWPGIFSYFNGKKISIEECDYSDIDLSNDSDFKIGDVVEIENEHGEKNTEIGVITKSGILILKQVKLEGKKSIDILSFVNGYKDFLDYNFL